MRLRDRVRYAFWRAVGTKGHLPQCRAHRISFVGREAGQSGVGWTCAPGCPAAAHRRAKGDKALRRWAKRHGPVRVRRG